MNSLLWTVGWTKEAVSNLTIQLAELTVSQQDAALQINEAAVFPELSSRSFHTLALVMTPTQKSLRTSERVRANIPYMGVSLIPFWLKRLLTKSLQLSSVVSPLSVSLVLIRHFQFVPLCQAFRGTDNGPEGRKWLMKNSRPLPLCLPVCLSVCLSAQSTG